MIHWIVTAVIVGFFVWRIVWGIRDNRNKEFLAKLMDCEYVHIGHGEYFISKK